MQCNDNYTSSIENFKYINLHVLKVYAKNFPGVILGLPDYPPLQAIVLAVIILSAQVIEKHFADITAEKKPNYASFWIKPHRVKWYIEVMNLKQL